MTQNPQSFAAPRLSSTQKPLGEAPRHRGSPAGAAVQTGRRRATFTLEPNPNVSFQRTRTEPKDRGAAAGDAPQNRFSAREPPVPPRASDPTAANTSRSFPAEAAAAAPPAAPALPDEEDLSSFFSADPVWDDPADDDLLCEMCESVESRLQSAESAAAGPPPERRAPPPSNGNPQPAARRPLDPNSQAAASLPAAGGSGGAAGVRVTEAFRDAKNSSGSSSGSTWSGRVPLASKRPNNPVTTVTSDVVAKCSAAEIELKKQRAMERRRQRLQGAHNLRAPT
ncbi:hypothetical protein EYF80_055402 [Liparis tanakae]|uniref:Ewing's tumor-associated antigen 1 n=1 Tax=Liparis tanakae TaxID=230148 RepID=A0A4Z2F0N9_9TELE|nr:hypothetical protein EYF80_055402 [Liparis tanakae]